MKDVLLIADLHGQFGKIDSFLDLSPEAVFIAGDITNMGPVDAVDDVLSRIDVPCFAVPGNCDPREILDVLEHSDTVSLHGSAINLGKMTLDLMRWVARSGTVHVHRFLPLPGTPLSGMVARDLLPEAENVLGKLALRGRLTGSWNDPAVRFFRRPSNDIP